MGVQLIVDSTKTSDAVALFCSTSGFAFGPVFDSEEEADEFLELIANDDGRDPRDMKDRELEDFKLWAERNRRNREALT